MGDRDLALVYLETHVPSHVARPASILPEVPYMGDQATIYGYGCNNRQTEQGEYLHQKQRYQFKLMGFPSNLCPGDSGGPVFVRGGIYWVNSGYKGSSGKDIFATATLHKNMLNHYADQMTNQSADRYFASLSSSSRSSRSSSEVASSSNYPSDYEDSQNDFNPSSTDQCEGLYGDGLCDEDCDYPDPDCGSSESNFDHQPHEENDNSNSYEETEAGEDICEIYGYYNDSVCDEICLRPDPDCLSN